MKAPTRVFVAWLFSLVIAYMLGSIAGYTEAVVARMQLDIEHAFRRRGGEQ